MKAWALSGFGAALGMHMQSSQSMAALLRHDVGQIVVLLHDLQDVAVVLQADVDLARDQQILPGVRGERLDLGLDRDQGVAGLGDLGRILGVEGVAEVLERREDGIDRVEQRDPAGVGVALEQIGQAPSGSALEAR